VFSPSNLSLSPEDNSAALRDLLSLLALSGLWAGKDSVTVLELIADAVSSVAPVLVSMAQVQLPADKSSLNYVKVGQGSFTTSLSAGWQSFADECASRALPSGTVTVLDSPDGALSVVGLSMQSGLQGARIWFGSRDKAFPSTGQGVFLRAAVTLAATALHTASIDYERVQANRAKDEFLAMLGHELRNPLAPIVTALDLIHLKGAGDFSREHAVIGRQVDHLSRLVDDLLDITRITRDAVVLKLETVNMRLALAEAVESVSPLIKEKRHRLTLDAGGLDLLVAGDADRIRQVLVNLLINAAKYTEPGGRIEVKAQRDMDRVSVSVKDNGIGIPAELLPLVFNLFEQGSTGSARARGGLGIGLAIVKKLVSLHGGSVSAQSDGPGLGASFTLKLPLVAKAPPIQTTAPTIPRIVSEGLRVLVVDDNPDALDTMETFLDLCGFEVLAARHPQQALENAAAFNADVYVLDIGLPGMDGYQLAEKLRQLDGLDTRNARFIALTGYGQASDRARALAAGFDAHFAKPAEVDKLLLAIQG
jgi:signal transduction histidine kinase/CheY-like chemotaxis protein